MLNFFQLFLAKSSVDVEQEMSVYSEMCQLKLNWFCFSTLKVENVDEPQHQPIVNLGSISRT